MKEYDIVELIVDKEEYAQEDIHKGMRGTILDPRNINGKWLVYFYVDERDENVGIAVKEKDLKLIYDSPTEIIIEEEVRLLNNNYVSLGISKGTIGILRDIKSKNGKWEVEFGDKKLMLARDEIEVVK